MSSLQCAKPEEGISPSLKTLFSNDINKSNEEGSSEGSLWVINATLCNATRAQVIAGVFDSESEATSECTKLKDEKLPGNCLGMLRDPRIVEVKKDRVFIKKRKKYPPVSKSKDMKKKGKPSTGMKKRLVAIAK